MKNHIWGLLIAFKVLLVGTSILLFSHPDLYRERFVGHYDQRKLVNGPKAENQDLS